MELEGSLPKLVSVLVQLSPIQIFPPNVAKINYNIILSSTNNAPIRGKILNGRYTYGGGDFMGFR
jgi:hypothetical protein